MKPDVKGKLILISSILLAALLVAASGTSLLSDDLYGKESLNWKVQSTGQDLIDFYLIVPAILFTAWFSYKNYKIASFMWAGVVAYIVYTFVIFCFSVHFNKLFLLYCSILGISFYSLFWFILSQIKELPPPETRKVHTVTVVTGIYFLLLTITFYFLWLSEIIPAVVTNRAPMVLETTVLFTNPVHVLDLAIFLPALFIAGIQVLSGRRFAFSLTVAVLSFLLLMDISIAWLGILMYRHGVAANMMISYIMTGLSVFTLIMIGWNIKFHRRTTAQVIRRRYHTV